MTSRRTDPDHGDPRPRPTETQPDETVDPVTVLTLLTAAQQLRRGVNYVNLMTPLGLPIARVGGAKLSPGPDGCVLATDYRFDFPKAGAFTVGNVILTKKSLERLLSKPRLLRHETRHCTQYACLGPCFLPAYGVAALWSLARTGDPASRNIFERLAGLEDGSYVERPARRFGRRHRQATRSALGSS